MLARFSPIVLRRRRKLLLSSSLLALILCGVLAPRPAVATEIVVPGGATVGQQLLTPGDTLTVDLGGRVTDNVVPVYANNDPGTYTVVNRGTIDIGNGQSISLDNLNLVNSGMIVSASGGGIIMVSGTVTNSGLIAGHDAIHASSISLVDNAFGGVVHGNEYGVQATNVDLINNAGTINGNYIALNLGALGTLNNASTGLISNHTVGQTAITVANDAGLINNEGDIKGERLAIEVGGHLGSLINTGNITANDLVNGTVVYAGSIGSIDNAGFISGGYHGISTNDIGSLANSGTIEGHDTGVFAANAIGSITNSGQIRATTYFAIQGTDIGSVVNVGEINGGRTGVVATGALGSLTNSGSIIGSNDEGVSADSIGFLGNTGLIQGGESGVLSHTTIASMLNSATGQIIGKRAVRVYQGVGSIANDGTIAGEFLGVDASSGAIGSLANNGHITVSNQNSGEAIVAQSIGSLTNTGEIGGGWSGIVVANAIGSVVNGGRINAVNESLTAGTIGSVDNSGIISGGDHAISASTIGAVVNSGTIIGQAHGVSTFGNLAVLTNTGTITAGAEAVTVGSVGSLTNSGLINSDTAGGVYAGAMAVLQNSGTIRGQTFGVQASTISALTNSGMIRAADPTGMAILETGTEDTLLTLNPASILIGHVDISGGTDTLNVGRGLNLALTFDTSVPELIETNGAPYVVVGNTVHVADFAAFAAAGVATADLAGGIVGAVGGAVEEGFDEKGIDDQGHFWLQAIGGLGHNAATQTSSRYLGVVAGADFGPDAVTRFGAFGGASLGTVAATSNVSSFYAGIYGAGQFEDFAVRGTLTGGHTEADTDRLIANNTLITGLETASSTQDAYFLAPGIVFTRPWVTSDLSFETSLALNYTGVFGQGFAEGLATGLRADGFSTHVFEAEGLLRLPFQQTSESGTFSGDSHAGIEGRAVASPAITGSLAGAQVALAAAGTQATAGLTAGGAMAFQWDGGASVFGGLDATLRSDGSAHLSANAGIKAQF